MNVHFVFYKMRKWIFSELILKDESKQISFFFPWVLEFITYFTRYIIYYVKREVGEGCLREVQNECYMKV